MEKAFDLVVEILRSRFDIDPATVSAEASFDDIGLDSLSQIDLATALKKQHGVEIDDEEMAEISTVGEVVALFNEKAVEQGVTV